MEHENPSGSKDRVPSEIRNKTYINKLNHTRHKKSVNVENPSGQISLWTMQQNQPIPGPCLASWKGGGANFNLLRPINIKIAIYCPRSGNFWLNGRQFHNFWATKMANPNFWGSIKFPDHWWPKKGGGADAPPPSHGPASGTEASYNNHIINCVLIILW